jgi:glycosyltransferase involved in cell wall biosynthesis
MADPPAASGRVTEFAHVMRVGIDCRKIRDFGIGTHIHGLVHGLSELGGDDDYIAFVAAADRDLVPSGFETVVVNVPNYSVRELFAMRRAIDRARLDLYHSPHFVVPLTSRPVVSTLHDVTLFRFPPKNPIGGLYVRFMTRRAARKSVRILTVTNAAKNDLVSVLHCDPARIVVIPNGIDDPFFRSHEPDRTHGRYFLFVGNDKRHKNVDTLVTAFEEVRRGHPSLTLVIVGAPFERFCGRDGVHVAGFVTTERLASLYRGAIALVIPSLEEGFGLPAAEAMASGTAVITSEAPALVEITGDAALHVDARSPAALQEAMIRLANDDALRARLGAAGVERAREFTWARCAAATRDVYRAVHAAKSRI